MAGRHEDMQACKLMFRNQWRQLSSSHTMKILIVFVVYRKAHLFPSLGLLMGGSEDLARGTDSSRWPLFEAPQISDDVDKAQYWNCE
jgi:hypothetical protein